MQAIDDYINGNLSDAKVRACRVGRRRIIQSLREDYGYGAESTLAITKFLFGDGTFQEACEVEHKERNAK